MNYDRTLFGLPLSALVFLPGDRVVDLRDRCSVEAMLRIPQLKRIQYMQKQNPSMRRLLENESLNREYDRQTSAHKRVAETHQEMKTVKRRKIRKNVK